MGVAEPPPGHPELGAQPGPQLPGQHLGPCRLIRGQFHTRQLPEAGQEAFRGPLADQHPALSAQKPKEEEPFLDGAPAAGGGDLGGHAPSPSLAEPGHRAGAAPDPPARQADQRPQIHNRLIPVARSPCRHQPSGQGLHLPAGGRFVPGPGLPAPTAQHPEGVPIHGRQATAKGDAEHRPGGVVAHPWQAAEAARIRGDLAPFPGQLPGGLVEEADPAVEPEPFPGLQHLRFGGRREGGQVGETLEKPVIVGDDPLHLGLLEHHFRKPDPVGIQGAPPGQAATVRAVPGQEGVLQAVAPGSGMVDRPPGQLGERLPRGGACGHEVSLSGGKAPSGAASSPLAAAWRNQGISPDSQAAFPKMMKTGARSSPGRPKRVVER